MKIEDVWRSVNMCLLLRDTKSMFIFGFEDARQANVLMHQVEGDLKAVLIEYLNHAGLKKY